MQKEGEQIGNFDIANFYDGIEAHTASLVQKESDLYVTLMLFQKDEENREYAQYWFPEEFREREGLRKSIKYLENYRLYFDVEENKDFFVYKMKSLFNQRNLKLNKKPLIEESLNNYLGYQGSGDESEEFKKEEGIMLQALLKEFHPDYRSFIPFPIFAYGELVGAVFFIYDQSKLREGIQKRLSEQYRQLTFNFTKDYELSQLLNMLQTFGKHPRDLFDRYRDLFATLEIDLKDGIKGKKWDKGLNPILDELGYENFYRRFVKILERQITFFRTNRKARFKSTIISIIVDSFAHNIGAHSLIALKWWFENRFKIMDNRLELIDKHELSTNLSLVQSGAKVSYQNLVAYGKANHFYSEMSRSESAWKDEDVSLIDILNKMETENLERLFSFYSPASPEEPIVRIPIPIDHHIYPFFEFLRNKSAFWSGVSRDTVFSGRIRSWYQLIKKFCTNTLFLGTVANSEGVNKVNIHIEILDEQGKIKTGGEFSKIDLGIINSEKFKENIKIDTLTDKYNFIREGSNYTDIRDALRGLDPLFLPGELIGQEAIYTIWENTLRNVKHYKNALKEIRDNGLNFCISIQEVPFISREGAKSKDNKLYKVGVWLHHPQQLFYSYSEEGKVKSQAIIDRQMQLFKNRIVTEDGRARLGGSYQDKVCSAMLMNNTFDSVEEWNPKLAMKHYFPYVYPASQPYHSIEERKEGFSRDEDFFHILYNESIRADLDISKIIQTDQRKNRYFKAIKAYQENIKRYQRQEGILKRYFHVWKGENCRVLDSTLDTEEDNFSRFRILAVNPESLESSDSQRDPVYNLRNKGVIRIVEGEFYTSSQLNNPKIKAGDENEDSIYREAYSQWLGSWLPLENKEPKQLHGVCIEQPSGPQEFERVGIAYIKKEEMNWKLYYHNRAEYISKIRSGELSKESIDAFPTLNLAHGMEYQGTDQFVGNFCRVRNHSSFIEYLFSRHIQLGSLPSAKSKKVKVGKLLETLGTHVTIFDNRVYDIVPMTYERDGQTFHGDFDYLTDQLNIRVFPEIGGLFSRERRNKFFKKTHFLIMHISFLERIWIEHWRKEHPTMNLNNPTYSERDVRLFFKNEIQDFFVECMDTQVPQNFILVITSGRGRGEWVESVKHPQITFRPIETILNAFEDGLSLKDDYQIKHNLCNLLFGS